MLQYDDFDDRAETRWLPYLMYFQRADYHSEVVNTDSLGFRISCGAAGQASVGGTLPPGPLRLLAGSSSAFGIGATSDAATLSSRLWTRYAPSQPWLNFAGRSYNSTQELLLFLLYRHLLPQIEEIVIFGGFNNLALAQLPPAQQGDHGAFFFCGDFFEQMEAVKARHRKEKLGFGRRAERPTTHHVAADCPIPELPVLISNAVELTARHLEGWRLLAAPTGARISYVLQPLATWWREHPAPQEQLLFDELDRISKLGTFTKLYGTIATAEAGRLYSDALRTACEKQEVHFLDLNPLISDAASEKDWLYVDRAHYTDEGHNVVARLVADGLGLS
jgi:hypothetical protein